jgi:hypothetical protein
VAVGLVDRPKILMEHAFSGPAVDGRYEDDVALIPLNVLEIFDEEILEVAVPFLTVGLDVGIGCGALVHK